MYPSKYGIIHPLILEDIREPPTEGKLGISGVSFVFYEACRLSEQISVADLGKLLSGGASFRVVKTEHPYEGIFAETYIKKHPSILVELLIKLGAMECVLDKGLRVAGPMRVFLRVHESGFVLLYGVFTMSSRFFLDSGFAIGLERSLRTPEVLEFVNRVKTGGAFMTSSGPKSLHDVLQDAAEQLCQLIPGCRKPAMSTQPAKGFAMQIWDMEEYAPDDVERFEIIEFLKNNCWEISAFLDTDLELVYAEDFWRRRSGANVFTRLRTAFAVLNDHLVYATPGVCLELSLISPRGMTRSLERLEKYGYDSTSIFLWSIVLTQEFVLGLHSDLISELLAEAQVAEDYMSLIRRSARLKQSVIRDLGSIYWIGDELREERHATLWRYMSEHKGIDGTYRHMSKKLRYLSDISGDMSNATLQNKQTELLTTLRDVTLSGAASSSGLSVLNTIVAAALAFQLVDFLSRNLGMPFGQLSVFAGFGLWVILAVIFHWVSTLLTKRETAKLGSRSDKKSN